MKGGFVDSGCQGRGSVGKTEAVQDFPRDLWRMNRGYDAHGSIATLALKNVNGKNTRIARDVDGRQRTS